MMASGTHAANKQATALLRAALYDYEPDRVEDEINEVFEKDAAVHLAYPFETLNDPSALYSEAFVPLHDAIPDLKRRELIVLTSTV